MVQNFVSEDDLRKALGTLSVDVDQFLAQEALRIVSAFEIPKFRYDSSHKKFLP